MELPCLPLLIAAHSAPPDTLPEEGHKLGGDLQEERGINSGENMAILAGIPPVFAVVSHYGWEGSGDGVVCHFR